MTTHKTFSASSTADTTLEPIPFDLDGVYAHGRSGPNGETTWKESFGLSPVAPAGVAAAWSQAFLHVDGKEILNPAAVLDFLYEALVPDSSQRLRALVEDPDRLVKLEVLGDVFDWASKEMVGGRPTQPPAR